MEYRGEKTGGVKTVEEKTALTRSSTETGARYV